MFSPPHLPREDRGERDEPLSYARSERQRSGRSASNGESPTTSRAVGRADQAGLAGQSRRRPRAGHRDRRQGRAKALPSASRRGYTYPMLDWNDCPAVERIPGKVSGEWLFRSTRVPVRALFENLEGGASVAEFLEWFPGVTREQVDAVLEHTSRSLGVSA